MCELVYVIGNQRLLRVGIGVITQEETIEVRVCALNEPHVSAVIARESFAVQFPTPIAPRHIVVGSVSEAVSGPVAGDVFVRVEEVVSGSCAEQLERVSSLFIESKTTVEAQQVVMLLDEIVSGGNHANRILFANVTLEAQHTDLRVLVQEAEVVGIQTLITDKGAGTVVAGHHEAEGVSALLAGKFHRHVRIDDCAGVYSGDRRTEDVYALQEEGSFLCEENRKSLVCRNHDLICFNLREIRIDCQVKCK